MSEDAGTFSLAFSLIFALDMKGISIVRQSCQDTTHAFASPIFGVVNVLSFGASIG